MPTASVSKAAVGASDPITGVLSPIIGFGVKVSAGATLTYKVQHCFGDPNASGAEWYDHDVVTGQTATRDGYYQAPVANIRLNVTAWTSGSATLEACWL